MRRILLVTATLLLLTLSASADTKSWAAMKTRIPSGAHFVVGLDLAQIAKSSIYADLAKLVLDQDRGTKQGVELLKTGCGIDVLSAITDVTVVGIVKGKHEGALAALGLDGVDKAKVLACLQVIADRKAKGTKVIAKTTGKITEYSLGGKGSKLYLAWLAPDVLALTDHPEDKAQLVRMINGKAARGDLKAMIAKTITSAPVWGGVAKKEKVSEVNGTVKGGYGTVMLGGGSATLSLRVVMAGAAEATALAEMANLQLEEARSKVANKLPGLAPVLAATRITANGAELTISASLTEKLLLKAAPLLDKIL